MDNNIKCPKCGEEIEINKILAGKIEAELKNKYESAYTTRLKGEQERLKSEVEKKLSDEFSLKLNQAQKQIKDQEKMLNDFNNREVELRRKERELNDKRIKMEEETEERIKEIKLEVNRKAKEEAAKENSLLIDDMKNRMTELTQKLNAAQTAELELLQKQRKLEDEKREFEIEKEKQLQAEKERILREAKEKSDEENSLRIREKEELIKSMQQTIEELKKKSERGSQQLQGEVQELALEEFLKSSFPLDDIQPVPKGLNGADVIQVVKNQLGQACGTIIWESKRTKTWGNDWTAKLKSDMRTAKADIPVIVSQVLPKDISTIGQIEGVWVVAFNAVLGISTILREQLISINKLQKAEVGKNVKMEALYQYLCSNEFKQRIEGIVEAFSTMKSDLDTERRSFERIWAKREKQIEGVVKNTTGMYGDLQGLIGSALPDVEQLSLPQADDTLTMKFD